MKLIGIRRLRTSLLWLLTISCLSTAGPAMAVLPTTGPIHRYMTTTDRGEDTRKIPGWNLGDRPHAVELCWWTPASNNFVDDDAQITHWAQQATASGCQLVMFDHELSHPTPERELAIVNAAKKASPRLNIVFYTPRIGLDPVYFKDRRIEDYAYARPGTADYDAILAYARRQASMFIAAGAMLIPDGQIARPDNLAETIAAIELQCRLADAVLPPSVQRILFLDTGYNWREMGYPPVSQMDAKTLIDVAKKHGCSLLVFQPRLITPDKGIAPLYEEFLR